MCASAFQIRKDMRGFNILDFGAVPNTLCTRAIQTAIDAAEDSDDKLVVIPKGTFLSGTLNLKGVSLYLKNGAVLMGSGNPEDYPHFGYTHNEMHSTRSLLYSMGHEDIKLFGTGTIDCNARAFYSDVRALPDTEEPLTDEQLAECTKTYTFRPNQPIFFLNCKHVTVEGLKIRDASCWTLSFNNCDDVHVTDLFVDNDPAIPNNDGMHFCSCRRVFVRGCNIVSGDDCIALSGITDWNIPCEDVVISDCILTSSSKAIVIGYMHSVVRNVAVSNCIIKDSNRAFCIMSSAGTGLVEHVQINNVRLDARAHAGNWWGNGEALCIYSYFHDIDSYLHPVPKRNLEVSIRDICITNLCCTSENVIGIAGEKGMVRNIYMTGLTFEKKAPVNLAIKGELTVDVAPAKDQVRVPDKYRWIHIVNGENISISGAVAYPYQGHDLTPSVVNSKHITINGISYE